jgi:hypothetical protein
LLTITGDEAGSFCGASDAMSIVDGILMTVDGVAAVVAVGSELVEFIR